MTENQDPCYTKCDDCQRHECAEADECLRKIPEKISLVTEFRKQDIWKKLHPEDPCNGCGYMLTDNLGCPEMERCHDYRDYRIQKEVLDGFAREIREKVYDELGVLYGEDAKRFNEYINAPDTLTPEQREMLTEAYLRGKELR